MLADTQQMPGSKWHLPSVVALAVCSGKKGKGPCVLSPHSDCVIRLGMGWAEEREESIIPVLEKARSSCMTGRIRLRESQRVFHDKAVAEIVVKCSASTIPIFLRWNHCKTVLPYLKVGRKQK